MDDDDFEDFVEPTDDDDDDDGRPSPLPFLALEEAFLDDDDVDVDDVEGFLLFPLVVDDADDAAVVVGFTAAVVVGFAAVVAFLLLTLVADVVDGGGCGCGCGETDDDFLVDDDDDDDFLDFFDRLVVPVVAAVPPLEAFDPPCS